MSDDLVKRARSWNQCWPSRDIEELVPEMADRIEKLEAERDEALNQLDSARHSVDVLEKRVAFVEGERRKTFQALLKVTKIHDDVEAKLRKCVGALGDISDGEPEWPDDPQKELDWCRNRAKRAIAELKGQNDE
jgi:chromosome segregation ATPase